MTLREQIAKILEPLGVEWGLAPLDWKVLSARAPKLQDWVRQEQHGSMQWFVDSLPARIDPRVEWPWAKSVLMILHPYGIPEATPRGSAPVVAGYARKRDYHRTLDELLRNIRDALKIVFPEMRSRWFCDALPVSEAELAVMTGLGWRGKNTLVLNRKRGSAFHLAGLLLDFDGVDQPPLHPDHCGTCTACIDACPTQALLQPGLLDASRCLSHWNIEDRETSEGVAADAARGEIFGCDICQQVCPWNRRQLVPASHPEGWPQAWEDWIDLCLPQGGFQSLLKRTPLNRAGRAKVLRVLLRSLQNVDKSKLQHVWPLVEARETRPDFQTWVSPPHL